MRFGYVDQGLTETTEVQRQFNINTYAPTMLLFKENTEKPADVIQVGLNTRHSVLLSGVIWWFDCLSYCKLHLHTAKLPFMMCVREGLMVCVCVCAYGVSAAYSPTGQRHEEADH